MFEGGHAGDWKRVCVGILELGPLLWSVAAKPKKKEEWLTHVLQMAMMSERQFELMTRRGWFYKWLAGTNMPIEEGDQGGRHVLNDEGGETMIGRLKSMIANTEEQLVRATKLYNMREGMLQRPRPAVPSATGATVSTNDREVVLLFVRQLEACRPLDSAAELPEGCMPKADARRLIAVAVEHRKVNKKAAMHHAESKAWVSNPLDVMMKMKEQRAAAAPLSGSANAVRAADYDSIAFRREIDAASTRVKWPMEFLKKAEADFCEFGYATDQYGLKGGREVAEKFLRKELQRGGFQYHPPNRATQRAARYAKEPNDWHESKEMMQRFDRF